MRQKRANHIDVYNLSCPEAEAQIEAKLSNQFEAVKHFYENDQERAQIKAAIRNISKEVLGHTNRNKRTWDSTAP